ncbi:hypothetical protein [Helicobacter macacae]|nr:hypothetical protein [Helicobacter macacae]
MPPLVLKCKSVAKICNYQDLPLPKPSQTPHSSKDFYTNIQYFA